MTDPLARELHHSAPSRGRPAHRSARTIASLARTVCATVIVATLAVAAPCAEAVVDVIEYYHAGLDHYFITALPEEIAALDAGTIRGWRRTGVLVRAFSTAVNGTNRVCRYYLPPEYGDSHFFSASPAECAQVRNRYPAFVEEQAGMHLALPNQTTGACKGTHEPVYRVWNRRLDSNHRYVSDVATRDEMVARGWEAEGYGPDRVAMCAPKAGTEPDPVTATLPPPCKGENSRVAVANAPHGMYVWAPGPALLSYLQRDVIGKDPTLCGASLVIFWSAVETANGVYDWSAVTAAAKPFTDAGLTVNLLFSEATEGATNQVTPAWVTMPASAGGAGAPSVSCAGQPTMPAYFSPQYEAAWTTFIAAAVREFSFNNSPLAASVGYMRFATGGGAEALIPPGVNDGGACQQAWAAAGYSYDAWNQHEARIITVMGSQSTDKQVMASLGQAPNGPNVYDVSNKSASVAVPLKVGFSFENLGTANVATPGTTPGRCNPQASIANLHWCQAYTTYVGQVPFAMQPITATNNTNQATMDIGNLLPYALDNNIQIFELYGEEWLQADSPSWPQFVPANQAKYQAALQNAALTLGATNGR